MSYLDSFIAGQTSKAIDAAAAKPFSVVLSVDAETKAWITLLLIAGLVAGVILKRFK